MNGATAAVRVFPGRADQAAEVRRWVRGLAPCEGDPLAVDYAELVASELFANAVAHTLSGGLGGTVTVAVTEDGHIHVHDLGNGTGTPCLSLDPLALLAAVPEDQEDGRGLLLVATLCEGSLSATPAAECPIGGPAVTGGCCVACHPQSWAPRTRVAA